MSRSKFVIGIYVAVVFVSGVLVGGFGHRLYTASSVRANVTRNPEEYRKRYLDEMRARLKLSQDQVQKLNAILDSTRNEFREFRERHKDEYRTIQDGQVKKINDLLTPQQQAEYHKMRDERDKQSKGQH